MAFDEIKAWAAEQNDPATKSLEPHVAATYREAGVAYDCDVVAVRVEPECVVYDAVVWLPGDDRSEGAPRRGRNGLRVTEDGQALELAPVAGRVLP
jgi:hypothetical protein